MHLEGFPPSSSVIVKPLEMFGEIETGFSVVVVTFYCFIRMKQ